MTMRFVACVGSDLENVKVFAMRALQYPFFMTSYSYIPFHWHAIRVAFELYLHLDKKPTQSKNKMHSVIRDLLLFQ